MKNITIWINQEDKKKLIKIAQSKYLSLSTLINIITKYYYVIANEKIYTEYINKGKQQLHIKLRNECKNNLNPMIVSNSVYLYLHNEKIDPRINYKNINKKIQSECDKTTDSNYMLNVVIRATYQINKRKY